MGLTVAAIAHLATCTQDEGYAIKPNDSLAIITMGA
jgi:hypothetical protein